MYSHLAICYPQKNTQKHTHTHTHTGKRPCRAPATRSQFCKCSGFARFGPDDNNNKSACVYVCMCDAAPFSCIQVHNWSTIMTTAGHDLPHLHVLSQPHALPRHYALPRPHPLAHPHISLVPMPSLSPMSPMYSLAVLRHMICLLWSLLFAKYACTHT